MRSKVFTTASDLYRSARRWLGLPQPTRRCASFNPQPAYRTVLGFTPIEIGPLETKTAYMHPQNLFRPERLIIPANEIDPLGYYLGVVSIKVGISEQLLTLNEVPASIFSDSRPDPCISFYTAEVGNQISVTVINHHLTAVRFRAAMIGITPR